MGGYSFVSSNYPDSKDTVEIFQPPYMFYTGRPSINAYPSPIDYSSPFTIVTQDPGSIDHACLIGVGPVTHHFDYGPRYVELMVNPAGTNTLDILPPPLKTIAPPGYYLLFIVDDDGLPSPGKLLRLDV